MGRIAQILISSDKKADSDGQGQWAGRSISGLRGSSENAEPARWSCSFPLCRTSGTEGSNTPSASESQERLVGARSTRPSFRVFQAGSGATRGQSRQQLRDRDGPGRTVEGIIPGVGQRRVRPSSWVERSHDQNSRPGRSTSDHDYPTRLSHRDPQRPPT